MIKVIGSADPCKRARYTEMLIETAQSEGSDYVSFSSFLAINRSDYNRCGGDSTTGASAEVTENNNSEEATLTPQAMLASEERNSETRNRPARSKADPWSKGKAAAKAVEKLIGKGQSSTLKKSKAREKKSPVDAHNEVPSRIVSEPACSSCTFVVLSNSSTHTTHG